MSSAMSTVYRQSMYSPITRCRLHTQGCVHRPDGTTGFRRAAATCATLAASPHAGLQKQQRQDVPLQRLRGDAQRCHSSSSSQAASFPTNTDQAEFPPYQVLQRGEDYDLRLYEAYHVVEMAYERKDEGYLALGAYMDGENEAAVRFVYTQPVVMQYGPHESAKMMQWYVGSRKPPRALAPGAPAPAAPPVTHAAPSSAPPSPTGPGVRLNVAGGDLVAVSRFSGYITPEAAAAARARLMAALERDGLSVAAKEQAGMFRIGQYGPVHTMAARYNEMMLAVQL